MEREDCKPGVRVRVTNYFGSIFNGRNIINATGVIADARRTRSRELTGAYVMVELDNHPTEWFLPSELEPILGDAGMYHVDIQITIGYGNSVMWHRVTHKPFDTEEAAMGFVDGACMHYYRIVREEVITSREREV